MINRMIENPLSILFSMACLLVASNASAREFEKRFDETLNGGAFSVSNVLLTCDPTDARCAGAKDFTGPVYQNGPFQMINIDVDSDATTFNSSFANLQLPANSKIVNAQLYWGGQYTDNGAPYKFFVPPNPNTKNEILFQVPGGSYVNVKGQVDEDGTGFYQARADVTDLVSGSGFYGVANAQLTTGKQMFGGWTLIVVVKSELEPLRRVVLWDGFLKHELGSQKISLKDTLGNRRDESSVAMNVILYDGDKGNYDSMLVDGAFFVPKNVYPLTDPAAAGDIGNSSITKFGNRFEDRKPFFKNTLGYDADLFEVFKYLDADEHIELEFKTRGDIIHIGVISVQSDIEDRFVQTDWGDGPNGSSSLLMNGETGFTNRSGHIFHDTTAEALHAVQFSYSYDGQQYEVTPVRSNRSNTQYYSTWRDLNSSVYPVSECLGTKYWLYREVDRSRVSWMGGINRRGAARPACDGNFKTKFSITGSATLTLSDDAGETTLTGTSARWWGSYTDGHIIQFRDREFKVEGDAITTTTANLEHNFYLDTNNNKIKYDLNSTKKWAFESDFDGRLESKIFDGLVPRGFGTLNIDVTQTNTSEAQVFFRTGDSIANVQVKPWEGPFSNGHLLGNATTNNHQFFQYAVVTKLTDPGNNAVESELTFNEISFNLYGIASPIVNGTSGTWTRVEEAPSLHRVIAPNVEAVDLSLSEFEIGDDYSFTVESDLVDVDQTCSTSRGTAMWFPLLLIGMFWTRRRKSF